MCQRDWPLEGTPIGPFLPTLDSVKSVGNSEKQHILGVHLLSTLRETHRQPSPARMEDSQGALQSLRRMRDSMLCSLPPPTPTQQSLVCPTLAGGLRIQWDPHQAKRDPSPTGLQPTGTPPPAGCGLWLWPLPRPAGPRLSCWFPAFHFFPKALALPLLSSRPLPVPSSTLLRPSLLSLPSPPHLGAPLPCIMHAVEAPNRIRHLRPSSQRESLCK